MNSIQVKGVILGRFTSKFTVLQMVIAKTLMGVPKGKSHRKCRRLLTPLLSCSSLIKTKRSEGNVISGLLATFTMPTGKYYDLAAISWECPLIYRGSKWLGKMDFMMRKTVFLQTLTLMHSLAFVLSGTGCSKNKSVAGDAWWKAFLPRRFSKAKLIAMKWS